MIALPTFKHAEIINEDLVMIHHLPNKIKQNKPIYTGFSILEISKAHMFRFHYDVVLAKYVWTVDYCSPTQTVFAIT